MNYKIGVIGSDADTFPFSQIGMDTFPPMGGAEELALQVARLSREGYAVLFISEELLTDAPALLKSYDKEPRPAIIPLPGITGGTGIGLSRIQSMVEKALGKNIL